jgi:hypothetical protein
MMASHTVCIAFTLSRAHATGSKLCSGGRCPSRPLSAFGGPNRRRHRSAPAHFLLEATPASFDPLCLCIPSAPWVSDLDRIEKPESLQKANPSTTSSPSRHETQTTGIVRAVQGVQMRTPAYWLVRASWTMERGPMFALGKRVSNQRWLVRYIHAMPAALVGGETPFSLLYNK